MAARPSPLQWRRCACTFTGETQPGSKTLCLHVAYACVPQAPKAATCRLSVCFLACSLLFFLRLPHMQDG